MLCGNCEFVLVRAIRSGKKGYSPFFESLEGFYESVAIGCLICRQLWYELQEKCQHNNYRHNNGGYIVEVSVPNDFSAFQLELREMVSTADELMLKLKDNFATCDDLFDEFEYKVGNDIQNAGSKYLSFRSKHFKIKLEFRLVLKDTDNLSDLSWRQRYSVFDVSTSMTHHLWKVWLRNCLAYHQLCNSSTINNVFMPSRLVEISVKENTDTGILWRMRVFHSTEAISYVTLSHCWGNSKHLKLLSENLSTFNDKFHSIDLLPKTYQHALEITAILGFYYIWIDSLCILQDDLDDWRRESSVMGSIYANASCNLAATSAKDGHQGCYNERDPTIVSPTVLSYDIGENKMVQYSVSRGDMYHNHTVEAPLNQRGWVVQERCLARRQLSFDENQVFWECAQLSACEQFPNGIPESLMYGDLVAPATPKPMLTSHNELELRQTWCSLVEHYSFCELSRKSDKTVALAGLATQYQNRTGDKYLAGLWERDFHKQLCWRWNPVWEREETTWARTRQYQGPTWSWFSIDGPVAMDTRFHSRNGQYLCFLRLIDARMQSSDPKSLHSFVSCEVRFQAIVLPIMLLSDLSSFLKSHEEKFQIKLRGQHIDVESDEAVPDERPLEKESLQNTRRWKQLKRIWNSELLWVLSMGDLLREIFTLKGIIVRRVTSPNGVHKYVRVGVLEAGCPELLDVLTMSLKLPSPSQLVDNIDLNDPRIFDLVRTIDII